MKLLFYRRWFSPMSPGLRFATAAAIALMEIALASVTATEDGTADINYEVKPIILPGATGAVALDYFAHDRATGKVWVPASNTGSVDVIDGNTDAVIALAVQNGLYLRLRGAGGEHQRTGDARAARRSAQAEAKHLNE